MVVESKKSRFNPPAIEALTRMRNLTEQALALDPSNAEAKRMMARVLMGEGRYLIERGNNDDAIFKFREALHLRPDAFVHAAFARALDKMGDREAALGEARTAISHEPGVARNLSDIRKH